MEDEMVRAGMSFESPTGRVTFLRTAAETDGDLHEQRAEYVPGSPFPPEHTHPDQDERFVVESGAMVFVVAGEERTVAAGEEIEIPRRTPHQARNASQTEEAVVLWQTRPALRTGEFFLRAHRLGRAGLLDLALLAHEYRDVFRPVGPQRLAVPVVGSVARLLGRRLPPLDESADRADPA